MEQMEDLFKRNLLNLRNPAAPTTFGQALLGNAPWAPLKRAPKALPVLPPKEEFSEKRQVIESLERFVEEKSQELNTSLLKIEGGELNLRSGPGFDDVVPAENVFDLRTRLTLESNVLDILLSEKDPSQVKVIFVTERFRPWKEAASELKSGFINELIVGFPLKTAELFEKMIMAMKLSPSEVLLYPVEGDDEDYSHQVMELTAHYKPEVIITLGAKATNKILKSNDRLSLIHGQFFNREIKNVGQFQVVPLFHPSIIETNQNMKKTAWADMQKIMKILKKLP